MRLAKSRFVMPAVSAAGIFVITCFYKKGDGLVDPRETFAFVPAVDDASFPIDARGGATWAG